MIPSPERTARILEWRESLLHLSDYHFFELIRMYLGEVKTPYNKQKLIEELSAFLRNKDNGKNLVKLLTQKDIVLLATIRAFALPTQEKLSRFFAPDVSFADLYEHLLNLEERLIVYRKSKDRHIVFALNPLVEPLIEPFLDESALLEENTFLPHIAAEPFALTPLFLGSLYSFFVHESVACKLDGTLKKRTELLIKDAFPFTAQDEGMRFFEAVFEALKNLSLLRLDGAELKPDPKKWQQFALLPRVSQLAYVCAASSGRFVREALSRRAQTVIDIAVNIPERGFSRTMLSRLGLLQSERHEDFLPIKKSRLASILNDSPQNDETQTEDTDAGSTIQRMIDLNLIVECDGVFVKSGTFAGALAEAATKDAGGSKRSAATETYTARRENAATENQAHAAEHTAFTARRGNTNAAPFTAHNAANTTSAAGVGITAAPVTANLLTIDADFSATLLPGAPLTQLLPLMQFLHVTTFDTVPRFELSRTSCGVAFDSGETDETIRQTLEQFSAHGLSQSLTFSLEDWFKTYSSASLYKGYVLKASKEKRTLIENNTVLAPFVTATLSEGIYLLDFSDDEEAAEVLKKCGLDFVGAVKKSDDTAPLRVSRSFLPLTVMQPARYAPASADYTAHTNGVPVSASADYTNTEAPHTNTDATEYTDTEAPHDNAHPGSEEEADALFSRMLTELQSRHFEEEQAEGLRERIKRRIILNPIQLRGDSVRFEKIEAGGMDFLGKVHIVDHAISSDSMIELEFADSPQRILGTPLGIEKRTNDAIIKLQLEPEKKVALYSVSKAVRIKRIRGSIFKETGAF